MRAAPPGKRAHFMRHSCFARFKKVPCTSRPLSSSICAETICAFLSHELRRVLALFLGLGLVLLQYLSDHVEVKCADIFSVHKKIFLKSPFSSRTKSSTSTNSFSELMSSRNCSAHGVPKKMPVCLHPNLSRRVRPKNCHRHLLVRQSLLCHFSCPAQAANSKFQCAWQDSKFPMQLFGRDLSLLRLRCPDFSSSLQGAASPACSGMFPPAKVRFLLDIHFELQNHLSRTDPSCARRSVLRQLLFFLCGEGQVPGQADGVSRANNMPNLSLRRLPTHKTD